MPVYAVLDATGRVVACGDTNSFVAPEGGQVVETDSNPIDGLPDGLEAYYDGAAFQTRPRVLSADEADYRDIRDRLQLALKNWDTLTQAQKDALLKVAVRGLVRLIR